MAEFSHEEVDEELLRADVVVIGAGLAGLCAAFKLRNRLPDLRVVVVEAKGRVGGRTFAQELATADGHCTWDLGGQWVGRCQPHIMELLSELKMNTYDQYTDGTKCMFLRDNIIRTYKSTIPSLGFLAALDLGYFIFKVERMVQEVSIENPAQCKKAAYWDAVTVEAFKQHTLWTSGAKDAIDAAVRTIFGAECSQVSLLYFLAYGKAAGSLQRLIEATPGSAQEYKIEGGAHNICHKLTETIGKDNVWLNEPCSSIIQEDQEVLVKLKSGKMLQCSRCIVAIPPHEQLHIQFMPTLPNKKVELYRRMPVGHIIKVIISYKQAFWRDKGFSGEIVATEGDLPDCANQPLGLVYDATSSKGNPALVVFISGKPATYWGNRAAKEREEAVKKSLAHFFGPECLSPVDYAEKDWSQEEYNGGCPVSTVSPGAMTYFAEGLRDSFGRIDFAGTESATMWCGFLSGAVQSGYRAASKVMYHLKPQILDRKELQELQIFQLQRQSMPKDDYLQKLFYILVIVVVAYIVRNLLY